MADPAGKRAIYEDARAAPAQVLSVMSALTWVCLSCRGPAPTDARVVESSPVVVDAPIVSAPPSLPTAASASQPSAAPPTSSAPPDESAPARAAPAADDPCLLSSVELAKLPKACDCGAESERLGTPGRLCNVQPGGSTGTIPGLEVTLTLPSPHVARGRKLEAVLQYRNTTDAPLELHFLRDEQPTLGFRAPDGARLPIEGPDRCAIGGTLSLARLRQVWLAPGAAIRAPLEIATRRQRRVNGGAGELDCDVEPASPLPEGRYQLVLESNALFAASLPAPVSIEVVSR